MANPLHDLTRLVASGEIKTRIATVISIEGTKIGVRLRSGVVKYVWGKANRNDTVLISSNNLVAVVSDSAVPTVNVR